MRKNSLLIAVAAAALAVGSGTAFAQGAPQGGQKADSPAASHANPASKNAPAEKIQGAEQKGPAANRMGEANRPKAEPGQKMGQDIKAPSNRSTTGQAPSERNSAGQANERRNEKMGQEPKSKRSTTGQAPSQQMAPKTEAQQPNRATGANENRGGASVNERSETRGGAAGGATVNLSSEQKTKIHTIIVGERSAPRVAHVDFDLNVGTVVPRGTVRFVPLPATIVEIEPTWRGYDYFLVGDQIVVVDPATLRIVAVLPA
jgi:hypothetical protein